MAGGRAIFNVVRGPTGLQVDDKVSENEIAFALDVGLPIPLVGRVDACATHRDQPDQTWGVEYKTSSEVSARFMESFQTNPQIRIYALALSTLASRPVSGVMVVLLQVAKTLCNTVTHPVYLNDLALQQTVSWIKTQYRMLEVYEQEGVWPQQWGACSPYPGFGMPGYHCEYASLCGVEDWTSLETVFYHQDHKPFTIAKREDQTLVTVTEKP
jgi:hypothetical protein